MNQWMNQYIWTNKHKDKRLAMNGLINKNKET